ncbi:MAG TPA: tyrosine-type recombinase/integrase [Coriobacteriia bacterium]|jgi:integrase
MPAAFEKFVLSWLATVAIVQLKASGFAEYETICRIHLVPAFGDTPIEGITPARVQEFVADKIAGGLSPRTVANHLHVLRRVLDYAVTCGLVSDNAASTIALPRQQRTEMRFLTPAQLRLMVDATTPSWRLLTATAALCGLRKGEQLALRFTDISIEDRTIRISKSVRNGVVTTPKTAASIGAIPLPDSLVPLLEERRCKAPDPQALVFCRADGSYLPDHLPNRVLAAALRMACLPQVRWHDLRHSWVVAHLQAGTDIPTLQRLGRWKSADTLLSVYAHVLRAAGGEAAARLDELLSKEG